MADVLTDEELAAIAAYPRRKVKRCKPGTFLGDTALSFAEQIRADYIDRGGRRRKALEARIRRAEAEAQSAHPDTLSPADAAMISESVDA